MSAPPLSGRRCVVTGASRGIGLAIARRLAGAGARVAMLARSEAVLAREAHLIGELAHPIVCDLSRAGDVERALATIETGVGAPDVLVNSAGAFALAPVGATSSDLADAIVSLNLLAPYRLINALVPGMRAAAHGDIVTIGSVADRTTFPENAAYAASKFGARALHQVLRAELRGSGVRASLVSPGPVDTPMWDPIQPETRPGFTPRSAMLSVEAVAEAVFWVLTRPAEVNIDELRLTRA